MVNDLIKQLLESGVHFGHQTRRWNPKMKRFIFGERAGIYIIDLEKTVEYLNMARDYLKETTSKGGRVLFIGTKKQAQDVIESEAVNSEMFYVRNRWLGGLLTNFTTVRKSVGKLDGIEKMQENGIWQSLPKKEISRLTKQRNRLLRDIGGIRYMKELPKAVVIVDVKKEEIAVKEANKLGIPIVAIVDTNSDPDKIEYPVPGNDDALRSIRCITSYLCEGIKEGWKEFKVSAELKTAKSAKEKKDSPAKQGKSKARKPAVEAKKDEGKTSDKSDASK